MLTGGRGLVCSDDGRTAQGQARRDLLEADGGLPAGGAGLLLLLLGAAGCRELGHHGSGLEGSLVQKVAVLA